MDLESFMQYIRDDPFLWRALYSVFILVALMTIRSLLLFVVRRRIKDSSRLYNEKQERIYSRFKVCDHSKDNVRLVITFEPSYPYHWRDEDKWDKL